MRLKNFNLQIGSQLMKAMGDESRLRILNLLSLHGPLSTSDLEFILDYTQTKTSRHLLYLKNSGILYTIRKNHWVMYGIKDEVEEIISNIMSYVEKDTQLLRDEEVFQTLNSNRELSINNINQ
jgi:DNA-binding transcriptional ArsR family regulator